MNVLLTAPVDGYYDLRPIIADLSACLLLARSANAELVVQPGTEPFAGLLEVEPAGIEPATSCLQRNRWFPMQCGDLLGVSSVLATRRSALRLQGLIEALVHANTCVDQRLGFHG
jgi:hypothetical protein